MRRALAALLLVPALAGTADDLVVYRLRDGRFQATPGAPRGAMSVGSLQKPFALRAWTASHPGESPPRFTCPGGDGCWSRPGHGALGLVQATALSCNAYFRALLETVPASARAAALREAGFRVEAPVSPDVAIGIDPERRVAIAPAALLDAYQRLVSEPWPSGEPVRRDLLAGLRGAATTGTAAALRGSGVWAKTGTSAAITGQPIVTSGWVLTVDDAGDARLALLPRGTGSAAALALSRAGAPERLATRPEGEATDSVTVELFTLLAPRTIVARNVGSAPVATSTGFVGPGGERRLVPGDRLERGLWKLSLPGRDLVRVLEGALACDGRANGTLRLRASLTRREYVAGVIAAELPDGSASLRVALGAAALRFLVAGPRHPGADVCDSTHCAFFVARGTGASTALDAAQWARIVDAAHGPGPDQWTSHCGGEPLSPHFVWGSGERTAARCPLHDAADTRAWSRVLPRAAVAEAFGPDVRDLRVAVRDDVWTLEVETARGALAMLYDEAHRRLAGPLGWGALPSPADRIVRVADGFRAEGRGLGHRVGLCLGESRGYANIAAAWLPPKRP